MNAGCKVEGERVSLSYPDLYSCLCGEEKNSLMSVYSNSCVWVETHSYVLSAPSQQVSLLLKVYTEDISLCDFNNCARERPGSSVWLRSGQSISWLRLLYVHQQCDTAISSSSSQSVAFSGDCESSQRGIQCLISS